MTFTESDAQNDGLIKREVGKEMSRVAKTQNPELFEHFDNVCNEVGREPWEVFGEMCVRALNSEEYSQRLMSSEVNMGDLRADEIRLEDVRYVKELTQELGLEQDKQQSDPIDQLINNRLESVTSSPLDNISRDNRNPEGVDGKVVQHMESLQNEIERLEAKIDGDEQAEESSQDGDDESEQSVDELFGDSEDDDVSEPKHQEEEDGKAGEPDAEVEEEGIESEAVEEAFEGLDGGVDDVSDTGEGETLEDVERENEIDDVFVTSEDGEEE